MTSVHVTKLCRVQKKMIINRNTKMDKNPGTKELSKKKTANQIIVELILGNVYTDTTKFSKIK